MRARGEGSLFFDKRRGKWIAQVRGRNDVGKIVYRRKSCDSQKEALKALKALKSKHESLGHLPAKRGSVRAYIEEWFETHKHKVRETTRHNYEQTLKHHVYPPELGLADKKLETVSSFDIEDFYMKLKDEGRRDRTCQLVHQVLSVAFKRAVRSRVLSFNPLDGVDRPRYQRRLPKIYTINQMNTFLDAAKKDFYYPVFLLALDVGLRQGEILGLKPEDLNLRDRKITINRQLYEVSNIVEFGPPKTDSALRTVDISQTTADALRGHLKRLLSTGLKGNADGLLFPDEETGGRMRKYKLLNRLHAIQGRAKLPKITFHQLRHSAATWMLENGIPDYIVKHRLGHSSIVVTKQIYAHVSDSASRQAADAFDIARKRKIENK